MKRLQMGSTLVELMISLVLSLALIAGIISVFIQMQKSKDFQQAQSVMMEDSRFVMDIMQREVRRAGGLRSKLDKAGGGEANDVFTEPAAFVLPATGVQYQLKLGEYIKGDLSSAPKPDNDSFVMRYQLIDTEDLSPDNPSNSSSPCTANTSLNVDEDPESARHVVRIFFFLSNGNLSCTSRRSVESQCNSAIGKNCDLSDPSTTLISNVQKMVVLYGIDADGDGAANYYVDAPNVTPTSLWAKVVSARLTLVLKSENQNLAKVVVPYTVEGTSYQPTDKSIYRVFSTTIALRNQV